MISNLPSVCSWKGVTVKHVCAEFTIKVNTAFIVPSDAIHDDWGKFAQDPAACRPAPALK